MTLRCIKLGFILFFIGEFVMVDYIPRKDAAFDAFFRFLVEYVAKKVMSEKPAWPHIPTAAVEQLMSIYDAWHTAYLAVLKPHTMVETKTKNNAKKAGITAIRPFVNQYLRFLPVMDEDRAAMGIHNPDKHPTPIKPPTVGPLFSIDQLGPAQLGIVYRSSEHGRKGSKPVGAQGARIYYGVFDVPPASQKALPASVWATRCPHSIMFREGDRGKRVYFALKWEIRRENGESPWSEIQSEIVP
jgi:hypothetical protein